MKTTGREDVFESARYRAVEKQGMTSGLWESSKDCLWERLKHVAMRLEGSSQRFLWEWMKGNVEARMWLNHSVRGHSPVFPPKPQF